MDQSLKPVKRGRKRLDRDAMERAARCIENLEDRKKALNNMASMRYRDKKAAEKHARTEEEKELNREHQRLAKIYEQEDEAAKEKLAKLK